MSGEYAKRWDDDKWKVLARGHGGVWAVESSGRVKQCLIPSFNASQCDGIPT
jgi:hypothetical protein